VIKGDENCSFGSVSIPIRFYSFPRKKNINHKNPSIFGNNDYRKMEEKQQKLKLDPCLKAWGLFVVGIKKDMATQVNAHAICGEKYSWIKRK
jgi:hypothetical protein